MKDESKLYRSINLEDGPIKIVEKIKDDNSDYYLMNSMTNSTFKVKIDDKWKVIRIPGYGTNKFITRSNEKKVLGILSSGHYKYLPKIIYSDTTGVIVTEFLENYHTLSKDDMTDTVALMLSKLHKVKSVHMDAIKIDLLSELSEYLKLSKELIIKEKIDFYNRDYNIEHSVIQFIGENQHKNLSICHRDMMYNNIMIPDNKSDTPKLIDWEYSGSLNKLWDLGCFISEYKLWFGLVDDKFIEYYNNNSSTRFSYEDILRWSAVVDYMWSMWSLAKTQLGDPNMEYGQSRYNQFLETWRSLNEKS